MNIMRDAIDTTTLGWIKPELDEALRQVRLEVETFAEAPDDSTPMAVCADHLHQVHGTLRMVELVAPAMVAEEMERLARALGKGEVADRDEACGVLMRGAVQLPDYLERLQGGHRDIPIVLLPLLNELRGIRGDVGLNESVLFAPDLDRPLPQTLPAPKPSTPGARAVSPHLAALREALAQWPEEGAPADAQRLADAVDGLLAEVDVEPLRRMLWVASSVAGALRDGALPATAALRQAFGGVEREARQLLDDSGFGVPQGEPTAEPTRQLLYHVAHAPGPHPALDDLRQTFELDAQQPSESEIEHARGSLSGRNRALLDTVSAAIKEDLLRVKDVLDLHLRTGQTDVAELRPQVEVLGRVSDTLGMMGLGVARGVVLQQRDAMDQIVSGARPADESALLDVAGALLYVDASLDDQVSRLGLPEDNADEDLLASESRRVLEVVVREAIANFGDARQSFVAFVETNWDHAELAEVPRLLEEVAGALRMLDLGMPADYLLGIRRYTETELVARQHVPNGQQLDTLADALASIEYYLEALREQRPNRERILDIARTSLESLGYWPLPAAGAGLDLSAAALGALASRALAADAGDPPKEVTHDQSASAAAQAPAASSGPTVAPSSASETEVAPTTAGATPTGLAVADGGFALSDDIDDEIREVFLEELEEEIGNLGAMLERWRTAPDNPELLRPIRRVFHTLKGSGRLVGARTLGEFSWKIENMLNRVLDGSRPASPAVVALVGHAHAVLPQLRDALQGHSALRADLAGIEAVADRLVAGEEAEYIAPPEPAPAAEAQVEVDAVEAADRPGAEAETSVEIETGTSLDPALEAAFEAPAEPNEPAVPASVDPVLLEILHSEVNGHLATIEQWLDAGRDQPQPADERLQRAIHTLNGAFAMTEVPVITEITAPTEVYVKRLLAAGVVPSAEGQATIAAVTAAVARTLQTLQSDSPRVPVFDGLAARMVALRDSLPAARMPFPVEEDEPELAIAGMSGTGHEADHELGAHDLSAFAGGADDLASGLPVAGEPLAHDAEEAEREHLEAERLQAERAEAERAEAERAEAERAEAERAEAERLESTLLEAERIEAERLQAEHAEAERLAEEEREYAQLEAEYAEQAKREQAEREQAEREQTEREQAEREQAEREQAEREQAEREQADEAAVQSATVAGLIAHALQIDADPDEPLDLSDLDPELVDIFIEEGGDLLDHSDGLLAQLRESPTERELLAGLQRDLHTLKGGARMAGIMAVGELGHVMESLLEAVVDQRRELGRDGVPLLERGFDRLHAMITRVGERRAIAMPEALIAEFDARSRGQTTLPADLAEAVALQARPAAASAAAALKPLSAPIGDTDIGDDDDVAARAPAEQVRIRADLLDRLVNYAGEVAIYRARLEQQLGAFRGAIAEMAQTNERVRDQLRRLEIETEAQIVARYQREGDTGDQAFDPLELDRFSTLQQLSRALSESAADQTSLQQTLDDLTRQYETLLLQQSRVSSDLQEGLMRTRMVPFDALLPRLRRVIRQASGELGKQVALKLDGSQGELDRNVLERMTAPLEHMLRNSVAHGLETPAERKQAGKAPEGSVRIAIRREGSEVVLEVADDGRGLDRDAIRRRGIERELIRKDAVLGDSDIDTLILEPGFSTATEVSRLAGRGVGMDVVASEVRQLGGTLDIHSVPGQGVRFTLRLPQTLAVTQAVFVKIGETTFAVPIASVRGVGRISREALIDAAVAERDAVYRYGGDDYAVHDLGQLLGHAQARAEGHLQMPVLLIRSGDLHAAVCVDQVLGNREIVVKPVGPQVASLPGIFGATIMGDGRVVVILDVAPLVRRQAALPRDLTPVPAANEQRRVPLVMVVDDSVTMRKVTGRVLERHNFEVVTAKDGIDALERMVEVVPDLMLLDIEMPRMDGYELATQMRADGRLKDVPIVMITSRTGDKHRQRAFEIGVQRYLGKPYQETELMRNVYELLGIEQRHDDD